MMKLSPKKERRPHTFAACADHTFAVCASQKMFVAMPPNKTSVKKLQLNKDSKRRQLSSLSPVLKSTRKRSVWGAHASSVLVSASCRNELYSDDAETNNLPH